MESLDEIQTLLKEKGFISVKRLYEMWRRAADMSADASYKLGLLQASVWGVTRIMSNKCRYRKPLVEALEQSETGVIKDD